MNVLVVLVVLVLLLGGGVGFYNWRGPGDPGVGPYSGPPYGYYGGGLGLIVLLLLILYLTGNLHVR